MSAYLASEGQIRASLEKRNLGFHAFLRASEICNLHVSDLCFPSDALLSDFLAIREGCIVQSAKTGKRQYIPFSDATLIPRLKKFVLSKPRSSISLSHLSYNDISPTLHKMLAHLRLNKQSCRLHSLRNGGATFEWLDNTPFPDVVLKGGWEAESSCKRYLNAGKALLVWTTLSNRSSRMIIQLAPRGRASASEGRAGPPYALPGPLHWGTRAGLS